MRVISLCAAALLLPGCTDSSGPTDGTLQVENVRPLVRMTNRSSAPIYVFVVESRTLAVIDWLPCADPVRCPGIPAGRDSIIPYSAIAGYEPDAEEAVLYWWHLIPGEGSGFKPDSIRFVPLDL
jgi:hypothetical protein